MATVTDNNSRSYAECDEFIQHQLTVARKRIRGTDLLTASVIAGLLLISYVLIFTLLDHWVIDGGFSPWTRAVMLGVVLLICAVIVYRFVIRPWFREVHPLYAARILDAHGKDQSGTLMTLIDLKVAGKADDVGIMKSLEKRAAVQISDVNVDDAVDRSLLVHLSGLLLALVLATCVYAVVSPKSISLLRPLTLLRTSVATRTTILNVKPGDVVIPAGGQVEIVADLGGVVPDEVLVYFTTDDRQFVDEKLVMKPTDDEGRFRVLMSGDKDRGIRQSLSYYIAAGDARSNNFQVTVDEAPSATVTRLDFEYPAYTTLPARSDESGNINAWEGTRVRLTASSTVPVAKAIIQFSDDAAFKSKAEEVVLQIDGTTLTGEFTLSPRKDGSFPTFYRLHVEDDRKAVDPEPTVYSIQVRRDQAPVVSLLDPTRDLEVPANAIVPLLVEAEDPDFLLAGVAVHLAVNGQPVEPPEMIFDSFESGFQKKFIGSYDLKVADLSVKAGDTVTYYVSARDNKPPLGNQSRSEELNLRIMDAVGNDVARQQWQQDREIQEQILKEKREPESTEGASADQPVEARENNSQDAQEPKEESSGSPESNQGTQPENGASESQPNDAGTGEAGGEPGAQTAESGSQQTATQQKEQPNSEQGTGEKTSETGTQPNSPNGNDPAGTDPKEPNGKQAGEQQPGGKQPAGEQPAGEQPAGEQQNEKQPTGNQAENQTAGQNQSGEGGGKNEANDRRPADDDEALHKFFDRFKPELNSEMSGMGKGQSGAKPDPQDNNQQSNGNQSPDNKPDNTEQGKQAQNDNRQNDNQQNGKQQAGKQESDNQQNGNQQGGNQQNGDQQSGNQQGGDQQSDNQQSDNQQSGNQQSGKQQSGNQQSGNQQSGNQQSGNQQSGNQQSGNQQSGNQQSGNQQSGNQQGDNQQGDNQQGGNQQSGNQQSGNQQSGNQQGGNQQGGNQQSGNQQGGNQQGGNQQGGNQQGGNQQGGNQQGGNQQGGAQQGGNQQGGNQQGGAQQGGNQQGGAQQGGNQQGGNQQGGNQQGGAQQGGNQQSGNQQGDAQQGGNQQGGNQQSGNQQGGNQQGGNQQGGNQQGGNQQGGNQQGGNQQGGNQQGGNQQGGAQQGGAQQGGAQQGGAQQGGASGGNQSGGAQGGSQGSGDGTSTAQSGTGRNGLGGGAFAEPDGPREGSGEPSNSEVPPSKETDRQGRPREAEPATPQTNADDAARAANMILRRIRDDLERGSVDDEMLKELGWTEEQLKAFVERMERQLAERELTSEEQKERSLQQKSFEEMLKGLPVKTPGHNREGSSVRDREQQDTTVKRNSAPARYREMNERYQRSISGGKK